MSVDQYVGLPFQVAGTGHQLKLSHIACRLLSLRAGMGLDLSHTVS